MKGFAKENKSERVIVHVRMRPFTEDELKIDSTTPIEVFDTSTNALVVKKEYDKKNFNFDCIFSTNSNQKEVFEKSSRSVVESVLKGYNGTILAYGQTGTGKTYTMVGDFESQVYNGIIPRAFDLIFDYIKNDRENKYNVTVSFIQIYLESIQDLLEPSNENVRIREDPEQGVYLEGVQWIPVSSTNDCKTIFQFGEKNRATASTRMNAYSSRSHAIFVTKIEKSLVISPEKIKELTQESNEKIINERVMTRSMLYLVDLAGSERVKKTKAEAMRLEEAKKINYSLLVLGNCIQSLTDPKSTHVSYRDSKLTRLLQESLGGNAKTSLIVTISPSSYNVDETISSLNFGMRAMKVQNKPIINQTVDYQALSIKLQEDLDRLHDQYAILKIEYDKLFEENQKIKSLDGNHLDLRKSMSESEKFWDKDKDSLVSYLSNAEIEEIKEKCTEEMKKLELYYEEVLANKITEQEKILQDIDKVLFEKDNELDSLKNEKLILNEKVSMLTDMLNDVSKEKEDLQKSSIELTNQMSEYQKVNDKQDIRLGRMTTENEALKAEIDALNLRLKTLVKETEEKDSLIEAFQKEKKNLKDDSKTIGIQTDKMTCDNKFIEIANEMKINCGNENENTSIDSFLQTLSLSLYEELKAKSNSIQQLNDQVKAKTKETEVIKETLKASSNSNKEQKEKIKKLTQQIQELNDTISNMKKQFEEESTIMSIELGEYRKGKNQLFDEKKELEILMKEKDNLIITKTREIAMLTAQLKENEDKLNKTLREKNSTNEDLTNEIKSLKNKICEYENDNKIANVNSQSYFNELKYAKNAFSEVEKRMTKLLGVINLEMNSLTLFHNEFVKVETLFEEECEDIKKSKPKKTLEIFLGKVKSELEILDELFKSKEDMNMIIATKRQGRINLVSSFTRSQSKSPEKSFSNGFSTRGNRETLDTLSRAFSNMSIQIGKITFLYYCLIRCTYDLFRSVQLAFASQTHEAKSVSIEAEYSQKNELYLKNSCVCLIQRMFENLSSSSFIEMSSIEDIIFKLNPLLGRINEIPPIQLVKYCNGIVDDLVGRISVFVNEKDMEVQNLNERIIYFLRENEILKKYCSDGTSNSNTSQLSSSMNKSESISLKNDIHSTSSGINTQLVKMQSQIKLKDEEIERLNKRLDEQMEMIKQLTTELAKSKNHLEGLGDSCSNNISQFDEMKRKTPQYEEEIIALKRQIDDQKSNQEICENNNSTSSAVIIENEVQRKTAYLKERLKKSLIKTEKKK